MTSEERMEIAVMQRQLEQEKHRADDAVRDREEILDRIDYQLEKHQEESKYGNRQYSHGIRDARKIVASMRPKPTPMIGKATSYSHDMTAR